MSEQLVVVIEIGIRTVSADWVPRLIECGRARCECQAGLDCDCRPLCV
jgi:hypothetical protein